MKKILQMEQRTTPPRFLAVDDEPEIGRLLMRVLASYGLEGRVSTDGYQALRMLEKEHFEVVLSDMNMPGMGGMQLLKQVRAFFPETAFVMVTGTDDVQQGVQVMKEGACDYLLKPLEPDTVVASVHRALELKRLEREMEKSRKALEEAICRQAQQLGRALAFAERTCDEVLQVLGCALNLRDTCTAGHSQRVTRYSIELARAMRCPPAQLREIARGAYLHDLGKIGIPDAILQKPGPLTPEEKAIMETHVRIGYELVSRISFMEAPAGIILAHQEHFDGTGYPRGLAGSEIPIGARIFALADTLDAMTSERPYRKALPFPVARDEIIRESGRQFDPEIVRAFLSIPEQRWENLRHDSSLPDFDCSFTGEADGTGGEKLIVWRRQPS